MRAISGLTGSYMEKLDSLKIQSLQDRRIRGDMIETFKIVRGFEDVDVTKFFRLASSQHEHATRQAASVSEEDGRASASFGLLKGPSRLDLRANFFTQRVIHQWNSLPSDLKHCGSINAFKAAYDKHINSK